MIQVFKTMAQNNAWANMTLYDAATLLPERAGEMPAPGFFPTLIKTLNHIYEVDLYYIDALQQGEQGLAVYDREDITDLASLVKQQALLDAQLIRFCEDLSETDLGEMRRTERRDGMTTESVSALLLHLFQHQVHHRGQAHVQLHALGMAPPQLDDFHLQYERAPSAKVHWQ